MTRLIGGLIAAMLLPAAVVAPPAAKPDPFQPLAHATAVQAFVYALAPGGPFYLTLRLYEPKPAAPNGEWKPPLITFN